METCEVFLYHRCYTISCFTVHFFSQKGKYIFMTFFLKMPKLSPTMEEGTITRWKKKEGEAISSGETLFEVATDKAVLEYQAVDEGWLRKILIQENHSALIHQPIAICTEREDEEWSSCWEEIKREAQEVASYIEGEEKSQPTDNQRGEQKWEPHFTPSPPLAGSGFSSLSLSSIKASPLAKYTAEKQKLDLRSVQGTGTGGRVLYRDLDKASKQSSLSFLPPPDCNREAGSFEEIPLTPMRKAIGRRLQEAKSWIPHFYVTHSVEAQKLLTLREEGRNMGFSWTINDCIIRATSLALRELPEMNRGFHAANQTILQFKTVDIAIAVSLKEGLITPIIRYADHKNLEQISREVRYLVEKCREQNLEPEEYQGGSFTLSNLGMYGIESFQAILNPPQSAILAVGAIREVPVVEDGRVIAGKKLSLTLSADHRVIDGAAAAQFLAKIKMYLENPSLLLLSISP